MRAARTSFACETLESRRLLSGSFTALTSPAPGGVETALQLSDGSIMVNGEGANQVASTAWYKLTPVNGSYVNGMWSTLQPMNTARRFFGSAVLPSGKVLVLGGEYSGAVSANNDANSGEIYDPIANTWTTTAPFPDAAFGDGETAVLSDGRVLCGDLSDSQTFIYNPGNNSWSASINRLNGDSSSEETWVKLPDDSILSYEIQGSKPQTAQRFILGATDAQDQWIAAGSVPVALATNGGDASIVPEEGPGVLLPDGHAFFIGATSNTAIYTPPTTLLGTGSWATGPTTPSSLGAFDAPGCVLPDGNVLYNAGSPTAPGFPAPTTCFEANPVGYELNAAANPTTALSGSGINLNVQPYETRMLMLPTGQVLFSNSSSQMYVWTESGAPTAGSAPTITNITNDSGSNTFTLTGLQLNGISEGASYGDDAQMATDFPLVRLTDQSGAVSYARTFNWTSTSLNGGASSVSFTEPSTGDYVVNVVANGIASSPVLNVQCSSSNGENFTIQQAGNSNFVFITNNGTTLATFPLASFGLMIVTGDGAVNTLVDNENLLGRPTIINGGDGNDTIDVENNGTGNVTVYAGNGNDAINVSSTSQNLSNVANFTSANGGGGSDHVTVYDDKTTAQSTYTINTADVLRSGFGGLFYGADIETLSLITGTAPDRVNIPSTYVATPVFVDSAGGNDTVAIGSNGTVQSIAAAVTVSNTPAFSAIEIDDSADAIGRTFVTLTNNGIMGTLAGLAPADINWTLADIGGINIDGGTGGNNFFVSSPGIAYSTTINTGSGNDLLEFANQISGSFFVNGLGGNNALYVEDNDSTATQNWLLTSSGISRSGFSANYTTFSSVNLTTGTGADNVDVESLPGEPVTIKNGGGIDNYGVASTSEVLFAPTHGLTLDGGTSTAKLTFDNSLSNSSSVTTITATTLLQNTTAFNYLNIASLTYNLPNQGNAVFITSTIATTAYIINGNASGDELDLGEGDLTNVVSATALSQGGIIFNPGGGTDSLFTDDQNSSTSLGYSYSGQTIAVVNHLRVTYGAGLESISMYAGKGNDNVAVTATATLTPLSLSENSGNALVSIYGSSSQAPVSLDTGSGDDTISVGVSGGTLTGLLSPVTITGQGGVNALTVNDRVDANFNLSSTAVVRLPGSLAAEQVNYAGMSSLAVNVGAGGSGNTLNVNSTAAGTPVTVNNNSGTDTINVNNTSALAPVIITPSNGNDSVNVDSSGTGIAIAEFLASQQIGALTIGNGGSAIISAGARKLLQTNSITTTGTGFLNLVTNDLIVHSSSLAAVNAVVKSGFNAGGTAWAGAGINSSAAAADASRLTALAVIPNTYDGGVHTLFNAANLFDGVAPAVTDILVKHTYFGDDNETGTVTGSDYSLIDSAYLQNKTSPGSAIGWYNGDLNYDGVINGSDYTLIDNAFNRQGASLAAMIAPARAALAVATAARTSSLPGVDISPDKKKKSESIERQIFD